MMACRVRRLFATVVSRCQHARGTRGTGAVHRAMTADALKLQPRCVRSGRLIWNQSGGTLVRTSIEASPRGQSMRLSTRLTVAMVALGLLATTAVGALTYRNIGDFARPRSLARLDTHAPRLAHELSAS